MLHFLGRILEEEVVSAALADFDARCLDSWPPEVGLCLLPCPWTWYFSFAATYTGDYINIIFSLIKISIAIWLKIYAGCAVISFYFNSAINDCDKCRVINSVLMNPKTK